MPDIKRTENVKSKGKPKIGVLKLKRETLRVLDAGELKQAQGAGRPTFWCATERRCTIGCGSYTRRC